MPIHEPQQDLVAEALPTEPPGRINHRIGLVGPEVITPDMRTFVGRSGIAHSCNPLICAVAGSGVGRIIRYTV
jgi:hypothetical protein